MGPDYISVFFPVYFRALARKEKKFPGRGLQFGKSITRIKSEHKTGGGQPGPHLRGVLLQGASRLPRTRPAGRVPSRRERCARAPASRAWAHGRNQAREPRRRKGAPAPARYARKRVPPPARSYAKKLWIGKEIGIGSYPEGLPDCIRPVRTGLLPRRPGPVAVSSPATGSAAGGLPQPAGCLSLRPRVRPAPGAGGGS